MTKNSKVFVVLVMLIACTPAFGQNSGFLGKKNIISVDTRLFIPMLYNFVTNEDYYEYKDNNGSFVSGSNLLSKGINISLGRTLSNQFAFHLQASVLDYNFSMYSTYPNGTLVKYGIIKATYFKSRAIGIMPILEFTNSGGILPIGLSNQIGFGIYKHTPLKDDYMILAYGDYGNAVTIDEEFLFDYDEYSVRSYSLMYKLNLKVPLNRSLLLNLGLRYNLNITQFSGVYSNHSEIYGFTNSDYREMVRRTQANNLVSFETGLSFVF